MKSNLARKFVLLLCLLEILIIKTALASPVKMSFDQLLNTAQEKSPDLQIKKQAMEQKSYSQWTNIAAWLPRADLQISDNQSNANLYTGLTGSEVRYKTGALVFSMPIYRRSTHLGINHSSVDSKLARFEYESAKSELHFKMKQLIGTVLIAEYKLASIKKSLEVAQRTAKETKIRFDGGSRSQIDVLKTQAQLTSLESQSLSARNDFQKALDDLREKSGLTKQDLLASGLNENQEDVNESALEARILELTEGRSIFALSPQNPSLSKVKVMAEFEKKSRARRAALYNFELADIKAASSFAKEWPELTFKATYQKTATNWNDLKESADESRTYGLTLNIPLFNFGSGYSSYKESGALRTSAQIQMDQKLKSAENQIEQLTDQIEVLQKLVQAQQLRKQQNQELERLTRKSYELGKSTVQDLLTAQNESISAKVDYAKARLDYSVAILQLEWNLGSEFE